MEPTSDSIVCILCKDRESGQCVDVKRGLDTLRRMSKERNDDVAALLEGKESVKVHENCRKAYTRRVPTRTDGEVPHQPKRSSRPSSASDMFDFKQKCMFCGQNIDVCDKEKHPDRKVPFRMVCDVHMIHTVRAIAANRADSWGEEVSRRLCTENDLVAAEARYHRDCYTPFCRIGSRRPTYQPKVFSRAPSDNPSSRGGRAEDQGKLKGFHKLCDFLENNDECQHTIRELIDYMKNTCPEEEPYSEKHLKRKLQNFYGESIIITQQVGKSNIVCFTGIAHQVINEAWYRERNIDETEEKMRIVETAARIIRQEIRSQVYDCSTYPTVEQISSGNEDLIPTTLQRFLKVVLQTRKLFDEDTATKRTATTIAHSIVTAARPRSFVSPLQLGLGITLHRRYGSRLLLDLLFRLGVCASYSETIRFEAAVAQNAEPSVDKDAFVQFVFDNADHNVRTLDGHGTFHAMGGIRCITPSKAVQASDPVPRSNQSLPTAELGSLGSLELVPYENHRMGTALIVAEDVSAALPETSSAKQANLIDMLWTWGYQLQETPGPGWNGFMDAVTSKEEFMTSKVLPLPFVNLSPSNPTTIYTCLLYAVEMCRKAQQSTCVVTFDQPLYAKALNIVLAAGQDSPLSCVVVRLGGFHMLMSFMGAVGTIMAGSGLEELWETVYAKNSVTQMVNGHAYARAVRAHLLTQLSLAILIIQDIQEADSLLSDRLKQTHSDLLSGKTSVDDVLSSEYIAQASDLFNAKLKNLVSSGRRTAKLWVRYFEMVGIMRLFVRAERSGDWGLHLLCVQKMIPYFHSAGHLNYAKLAHLYLQQMLKIEDVMTPLEFRQFVKEGCFTVRRSEKFWSGIWTDMTIEQVLMRNIKTAGGLTRGRGLTDNVIARWVCAMPTSTNVIDATETFCGVFAETSDQHVELRESRQVRDKVDVRKMVDWLQSHHPFNDSTNLLVSLSTGVVADDTVNCDEALSRGLQAMQSLTGQRFSNIHLKRNNKVITFATASKTTTIKDTVVEINPNQLFHRLLCVVRDDDDLEQYLTYELAARPPALFDGTLMRKGTKSGLIDVLEEIAPPKNNVPVNAEFTVDGGFLLHRVVWTRPANFSQICLQYVKYVKNHFGQIVTVVFDGYESPSTKDEEHTKRNARGASAEALIDDSSPSTSPQGAFLANVKNKVRFIALLSRHLMEAGVKIIQAPGDADTVIVKTAVQVAINGAASVIVGEDTDLLVLMAATSSPGTNVQMLMPGRKDAEARIFSSEELIAALGDLRNNLLFFHAATGCDTTSGPFRKGKKGSFKKFKRDACLRETVSVFNVSDATHHDIAAAGERFLLALYGCEDEDNLNSARHRLYRRTVAKQSVKTMFDVATLPPTSAAAKQHSYRVYHQVQVWMGNRLPEAEWGWVVHAGQLKPIPTREEPAPERVLNILSCNCKSGCEKRCGCRRNGFPCTSMCGYCAGHGCTNRMDCADSDIDDDVEPLADVLS